MDKIIFLSAIAEAIVIVATKKGYDGHIAFYVITFVEFVAVTFITLYGLNKVRKGNTLIRTAFCLVSMFVLLLVGYAFMAHLSKTGLSNFGFDEIKSHWKSVAGGQGLIFLLATGWGLTDVSADIFNVF